MYQTIQGIIQGTEFSVVESFEIESREARYQSVPEFLGTTKVGNHLNQQHPNGIWAHQAQALEVLGKGDNLVISTGTASGKSLVFQSLAFHQVITSTQDRVLVLYPLRALAADQLRSWRRMARELQVIENTVGRIDGTVQAQERDAILQNSRIIIMTPDVCHAWLMSRLAMPVVKEFVSNLSTVVMDEAHTSEGVFGSNFAFLVRRLVAARNHLLGNKAAESELQFVAATATIENPREHLKQLTGKEFTAISHSDDGAPRHERIVAHIACAPGEELQLANELQRRALHNGDEGSFITFVDSRKGVETLAIATQGDIEELLVEDPSVAPYRAGFTPDERQRIESRLRSKELRGVVSTSALELGIDIPSLSVGFNVGIPPTRKAYRQRLGRVGRGGPGAFVVIGPSDAFRRYGTTFREYHDMSVEPSYLYLDNRFMQFAHARCLADEREALAAPSRLPARIQWPEGFGGIHGFALPGGNIPTEFDAMAKLGGDTPHRGYPLRNIGETNFQIKRGQNAESMGQVNESQALRECYPGATYFHNARAYRVVAWNATASEPFIRVENTSPRRLTRPRVTTWVNATISESDIIQGNFLKGENGFLAECQMLVTERVEGYFDNQGQFLSYQELQQRNPNMRPRSRNFRTSGVLLSIDQDWFKKGNVKQTICDKLREVFAHGYSILSHDIGSAATNISIRNSAERVSRGSCIAIFDNTYGSLRFTEKLYLEFETILERLRVAAETQASQGVEDFQEIVRQILEEYSTFAPGTALAALADEAREGYEQVFAQGSRVLFRSAGQIASEVEIIDVSIIDGILRYRVSAPGQPSMRRWVPAGACEPSAEADAWNYAWWNRETETYETPPEDF